MKTKLLKLALCAFVAALPIGAWATVNSISSYKLWTFNTLDVSSYGGAFPSNTEGSNTDLTGDGVIYTGNSGSSLQEVSPSATGLTLNGVALDDISQVIRLQENYKTSWTDAFNSSSRNGETYNKTLPRSLAINVTVPGTLYVKVRSTSLPTTDQGTRNFELLFNPNSNRTYPHESYNYRYLNTVQPITDTDIHELSVFGDGAGTFWFRAGKPSDVYAILFVPAYTLTKGVSPVSTGSINVETAAISSDYFSSDTKAGTMFYSQNTVVSLNASPVDGYKFVSWTGVDSSDGATATVTMNADKNVTATFEKKVATTVWKFDQYAKDGEAIFYESLVGAAAGEYLDGLYFHSRDKKSDDHGVKSKKTKVTNADLTTHFGTYKKNTDYMAALLGTGGGTLPGNVAAGICTSIDGISYKAPAAGKFYATVVKSANNNSAYVYKNGEQADFVTFSDDVQGKEFEIDVEKGDNIYLFSQVEKGNKAVYLLNVGFVPTTDDVVTKTVTLKGAGGGYATFSATQNYSLPADVSAYIVSDVSDTKATMTKINEIPACTGVILYKEGVSSNTEITLTSKETTTVDVSNNKLKANIVDYNLPADDGNGNYNYTLAAGPTFKHADNTGTTGTLAAGKAFLRTNVTGAGARSLELDFDDDETTGIKAIETSQYTNDIYFNLAGQRVEKPTKGLYIVNGKKVVIK